MTREEPTKENDLTRRDLLLAAGTAGATVLLAQPLLAQPKSTHPRISLEKRLEVFGAAEKASALADLEIKSGKKVVLTRHKPVEGGHLVKLVPKTLYDVKKWIGIPDEAITRAHPPVRTLPPSFQPRYPRSKAKVAPVVARRRTEVAQHHLAMYNFVFNHSSTIQPEQLKTIHEQYIKSMLVYALLFRDIHVSKDATLLIEPSLDILFAHYITIDRGGKIVIPGVYLKMDCAGIRGPGLLHNPVGHPPPGTIHPEE